MSGLSMDRRAFLGLGAGALGVAVAPAFLRPRERLVRRTFPVMGTVGEIAVPARSAALVTPAMDAAIRELWAVEHRMSRFLPDSEVGRFNGARPGETVTVSEETAFVVREALAWAARTDGAFDPTLAALAEAWDGPVGGDVQDLPDAELLRRAAGDTRGWRALSASLDGRGPAPTDVDAGLEASFGTTSHPFERLPGTALDLGAIAKGWGVDRAAAALRRHGLDRGLVNVGGDLMALGEAPGGRPWRIGVRDPRDPARTVRTVEVVDRAVATSGDYLRFFEHDGVRYPHILDPRSASPARNGTHTVTVLAGTVMAADAAATTAFVLGAAAAAPVLAGAPGEPIIVHRG